MSVLENTPHLEAIGYNVSDVFANSLRSEVLTPSRVAVWSMNAPVPPAQPPFMRISGDFPFSKKIILLSSPPMSINVRTWLNLVSISLADATTSCTKGIFKRA